MPKPEAGSAKALSNAMKSRGLQKLKYYCEMCKKQCRDDNAFKCHSTSETHQRQMRLFAENHAHYINEYSKDFEHVFLDLLKRRYFSKSVPANKVYVDMISNKHHIHMNSTKWTTLTGFVEYLGKTGKCVIEHSEKGPLIQYIDKSPEAIAKKLEAEKRAKADKKTMLKENKDIEKLMEALKNSENQNEEKVEYLENILEIPKISNIQIIVKKENDKSELLKAKNPFEIVKKNNENMIGTNKNLNFKTKHNKVDEFLFEIKERKKVHIEEIPSKTDDFQWILPNLIVKIKDKTVDSGSFFNKKGVILSIEAKYLAFVELLDSKEQLKIDQKLLETVIPKVGNKVKIVKKGEEFAKTGILQGINEKTFTAAVFIEELIKVYEYKYEDICKYL